MTRRGEGEATFEADGKTWTLRFDFNAMVDFEEATGGKIFDMLASMESGTASPAALRALIWAMLRDHHPDITLHEAGKIAKAGLRAMNAAALSGLPNSDPAGENGEDSAEKPLAATIRTV
jgi:hypothetical protein